MTEVRPSVMPNSIEAERSVLGAMLLDRAAAEKAAEDLTQEDFYDPGHREIFDAMLALFRSHRPVDITTLDTELTRRGSLEGIGGSGYLVDLTQMVPTTATVAAYIQIVFPECKVAYNLDGGGSTNLMLNGRRVHKTRNSRSISGLIYFASAVTGEE